MILDIRRHLQARRIARSLARIEHLMRELRVLALMVMAHDADARPAPRAASAVPYPDTVQEDTSVEVPPSEGL